MAKPKVFISYSSVDRESVKALAIALSNNKISVWYDQNLIGGQIWWEEILEQIRNADTFIIALSKPLLESEAANRERKYARELGKFLLPVKIDPDLNLTDLPTHILERQIVEYYGNKSDLTPILKAIPTKPLAAQTVVNVALPIVPIGTISEIHEQLAQTILDYDTQKKVLNDLEWHLKENPKNYIQIVELLQKMADRKDIAANVLAKTIDLIQERDDEITDRSTKKWYTPFLGFERSIAVITVVLTLVTVVVGVVSTLPETARTRMWGYEVLPTGTVTGINEISTQEAATAGFLLDLSTLEPSLVESNPSPTLASISTTSIPNGSVNFDLLVEGRDALTISMQGANDLSDLSFLTNNSEFLVQDQSFLIDFVQHPELFNVGTCIRFIRTGQHPPTPLECEPELTYQFEFSPVNIFWWDDNRSNAKTIWVQRGEERIAICSNTSERCRVRLLP